MRRICEGTKARRICESTKARRNCKITKIKRKCESVRKRKENRSVVYEGKCMIQIPLIPFCFHDFVIRIKIIKASMIQVTRVPKRGEL